MKDTKKISMETILLSLLLTMNVTVEYVFAQKKEIKNIKSSKTKESFLYFS